MSESEEAAAETRVVVAGPEDGGERLDAVVARATGLSRTRVQKLIDAGRVRVEGAPALRRSETVAEGQRVEVDVPAAEPVTLVAEAIPLDIVYEDEALLVVNKASGMVVHPAPGHPRGTLGNALLHHVRDLAGVGGRLRPGIVHRLDKDTSGLLVVAKSDEAHQGLAAALKERRMRRLYHAASWGHFTDSSLTLDAPIGRDSRDRKRMAVTDRGRRAVTRARVRERWIAAELLHVALQTGRTHQIRVHLSAIGHPVAGDERYGGGRPALALGRPFLHAERLAFVHPSTGAVLTFTSALPADLDDVLRGLA
jgi:23S rRNA pseudouridine1911/1915/1917 synthase